MPRYRRRSSRVLLIDAQARVLLFHHLGNAATGRPARWITPGGGRRRWESAAGAAARELREETGLRVRPAALGRLVAFTEGYDLVGGVTGLIRNDYFLHRVTTHTVDTSRFTEHERRHMAVHRWWPVTELSEAADGIVPADLPELLDRLLAGWRPAQPVRLPWLPG